MVLNRAASVLFVTVAFTAIGCNIEVGNPEPEPAGYGRAMNNLSFELAAKQACVSVNQPCTAAAVLLPGADVPAYTFEMTGITLQLNSVELKPYAAENILTQIDLLSGTTVALSGNIDAANISGLVLDFAGSQAMQSATYTLQGNLISGSNKMPLRLSYSGALVAATDFSANGNILQAAQFDSATWFDFRDSQNEISHLMKSLSGGACRDLTSASCKRYTDILAARVSAHIARSLSLRTTSAKDKAMAKEKIGG